MPIRSRYVEVTAAIGLVLVVASCDKSPTTPRLPEQGSSSTVTTVTTVRVELVAPSEIAPGESVQLTANAIKSDGSVENVSSQARWTPIGSRVVQLSSTGLATGNERGEQVVSARFGGRGANARIFVLPKGTFRLAGAVQDSGFGLQNVALTVTSGVGEGLTTLSGVDGAYALYGVSGPVRVQLKKEGYLNSIQQIDVTAHRTRDFIMDPERPRQDYSGTYVLTITAAPSCRPSPAALPDEATRRVYTANVTQDGGRLTVTLTGADFIVTDGYGNRFFGFIDPTDMITFPIGDPYYFYYYDEHYQIVEHFRNGALIVVGNVAARGARGLITGTLAGAIATAGRTSPPYGTYSGSCFAPTHRFEMVRR
jgi:hypothetical protein